MFNAYRLKTPAVKPAGEQSGVKPPHSTACSRMQKRPKDSDASRKRLQKIGIVIDKSRDNATKISVTPENLSLNSDCWIPATGAGESS